MHFTRGDVNDRPKLWTLLQEVDCVYHLAARVSVQESELYPREYNAVNVGGTVSLMEAMRDVGVRRVVLAVAPVPSAVVPWFVLRGLLDRLDAGSRPHLR